MIASLQSFSLFFLSLSVSPSLLSIYLSIQLPIYKLLFPSLFLSSPVLPHPLARSQSVFVIVECLSPAPSLFSHSLSASLLSLTLSLPLFSCPVHHSQPSPNHWWRGPVFTQSSRSPCLKCRSKRQSHTKSPTSPGMKPSCWPGKDGGNCGFLLQKDRKRGWPSPIHDVDTR